MDKIIPCWHTHHEMACPVGFVDFQDRQRQIRNNKPVEEWAIRLRYLKPVKGELPIAFWQAGYAVAVARQAYRKTGRPYRIAPQADIAKARRLYDEAEQARTRAEEAYIAAAEIRNQEEQVYMPEIMALHAKECGCAWTPENNNILTLGEETNGS